MDLNKINMDIEIIIQRLKYIESLHYRQYYGKEQQQISIKYTTETFKKLLTDKEECEK